MVRELRASDHCVVRLLSGQVGQATIERRAVAVGVVARSGAPVTAMPADAPPITRAFPRPHPSRRRWVVRGLAPHRAAPAGAAASATGSSLRGAPAQTRDGVGVAP